VSSVPARRRVEREQNDWIDSELVPCEPSLRLFDAKLIGQNFYIPPIVFAIERDDNGDEKRVCIDGKQRCSSIVDFISGKIPFLSPATGERFWYCKSVKMGTNGKLATQAMKSRFDMIQIQAVEYDFIPDTVQRDIFRKYPLSLSTPHL
jgi:hypothetical protein